MTFGVSQALRKFETFATCVEEKLLQKYEINTTTHLGTINT